MPLIAITTEKTVPGNAGWYWYKHTISSPWEPIKVAADGWGLTFMLNTHSVNVADAPGRWGSEILPPPS